MFSHCIVYCLVVVLALATFASAQMCKNADTPFQSAACPQCTLCTGPTSSCCDVAKDGKIDMQLGFAQLLAGNGNDQCKGAIKKQMCAICDPKNQDFVKKELSQYSLNICKSACLELKSACQVQTLDCSSYHETNCWSGAQSISSASILGFIMTVLMVVLSL